MKKRGAQAPPAHKRGPEGPVIVCQAAAADSAAATGDSRRRHDYPEEKKDDDLYPDPRAQWPACSAEQPCRGKPGTKGKKDRKQSPVAAHVPQAQRNEQEGGVAPKKTAEFQGKNIVDSAEDAGTTEASSKQDAANHGSTKKPSEHQAMTILQEARNRDSEAQGEKAVIV